MDDLSGISLHIAGEQEACAGQLLLTRSLVTLIFLIISSSIFAQKFSFVIADLLNFLLMMAAALPLSLQIQQGLLLYR